MRFVQLPPQLSSVHWAAPSILVPSWYLERRTLPRGQRPRPLPGLRSFVADLSVGHHAMWDLVCPEDCTTEDFLRGVNLPQAIGRHAP